MSDSEQAALLHKHFSQEQVVCLEYVAKRAAQDVMREHGEQCPFERKLYSMAGKAIVGFVVFCVGIGGIVWGIVQAKAEK